jgi:hypothetical protein
MGKPGSMRLTVTNIRRIDQVAVDTLRWLWKHVLQYRDYLWLWWHFSFCVPLTESEAANQSLKELCSYKVLPRTQTQFKCCIPLFRRWRFGVLVFFVPTQQQSRFWTLCWVRWVDDPLELYLVRSAARRTRRDHSQQSTAGPILSSLDEVSEELDSLLSVEANRVATAP